MFKRNSLYLHKKGTLVWVDAEGDIEYLHKEGTRTHSGWGWEKVYSLPELHKKPITPEVGQLYSRDGKDLSILARVDNDRVTLICLNGGNRWTNPIVAVGSRIPESKFDELRGNAGDNFTRDEQAEAKLRDLLESLIDEEDDEDDELGTE